MTPSGHFDSLVTEMLLRSDMAWGRDPSHPVASYDLCTRDAHGMLHCWSLPELEFGGKFEWRLRFVAFGPHGKVVMNFPKDHPGELKDRRYNATLKLFPDATYTGFSPDGERFIVAGASGTGSADAQEYASLELCDSRDGRRIAKLAGQRFKNWHFTPNSQQLIAEHGDGHIDVWYSEDGRAAFSIPAEVDQQVTDISPDSNWLVIFSPVGKQVVKVWNLFSGESSAPYIDSKVGRDLGAEWLPINASPANTDRIFAYSHKPPRSLPRLNDEGSTLITGSGLIHLADGVETAVQLKALIEKHVPFRLQDGRVTCLNRRDVAG